MGKVMRLHPGPSEELAVEHVYADLAFPGPDTHHEPPYVAMNMVSTLDGRVSVGGKASPIGSDVDRAIMRNIRCAVDAVLVGAGTVRAEEMNLRVNRELSDRRKARGLTGHPLGVILAGSGDLPLERKVFRSTDQRVIIIAGGATPEETLRKASDRGVPVLRTDDPGLPSPEHVLSLLKNHFGANAILLEGGPSINGSFLSSGKVDELFMTLSPKLSSSTTDALTISSPTETREQPHANYPKLTSVHASPQEGELYLRYLLPRP